MRANGTLCFVISLQNNSQAEIAQQTIWKQTNVKTKETFIT